MRLPKKRIVALICFDAVVIVGVVVYALQSGVLRSEPISPGAFVYRGCIPFSKGYYDEAIPWFTKAIRVDPECGRAYDLRGQAYMATGEYRRAIRDFDAAVRLNPNDCELNKRRVKAHETLRANH